MSRSEYTALPLQETEGDNEDTRFSRVSSRTSLDSVVLSLRPRPSLWRVAAGKFRSILTPSFLQGGTTVEERAPPARRNGISTDWLDGLRGVASFLVFCCHYTSHGHPYLQWGYGGPDHRQRMLIQLPIINLVVHGRAMVAIFFVISGYALSFSALKVIHKQDYDTLLRRMSSSVFRRGMRLALPSFASVFLHYLAHITNIAVVRKPEATFWSDTKFMFSDFEFLVNPFAWKTGTGGMHYNGHLWTIPIEFRGSMVLFLTVLGLARARPSVRMATVAGLVVYSMAKEHWDVALFLSGIVLAESNLLLLGQSSNGNETSPAWNADSDPEKLHDMTPWYLKINRKVRQAGLIGALILGLYILSYPMNRAEVTPGFIWMSNLFTDHPDFASRGWLSIGAVIAVTAISFMRGCQVALETRPIRYLGRISFALYLVHGIANMVIGIPLIDFMWIFSGTQHGFWREFAWVFSTLIYIPILIWMADIFWRLVDARSVPFAKYVEGKCLVAS